MHLVSSFEQSPLLELAVRQLRESGIAETDIAAIPLDPVADDARLFDTIHRSDGKSLLDLSAVLATLGAVLGASLGFRLPGGPILCGLAGLAAGAAAGLALDLIFTRSQAGRRMPAHPCEVVLVVRCEAAQAGAVRRILRNCRALGIGESGAPPGAGSVRQPQILRPAAEGGPANG